MKRETKPQKFIQIRVPWDLHQQLNEYCKAHLVSMSSLILQFVVKEINYKPRSFAPRTYTYVDPAHLPKPKPGPRPIPAPPGIKGGEWFECDDDDDPEAPTTTTTPTDPEDDIDWEDLKRRAANAPLRPVRS